MYVRINKIKLNKERLRDKIYAAWIGKNIGGTIGAPYEGNTEMQDIHGFVTEPGKPLPNDDLDLQLMWLLAMEQEGPWYLNSRTLAEYWLTGISPYWNEYGRGKANLMNGIPPTVSGELHNERWRHSNGAWIRSEIWASLAPGFPGIAREYAFADATVDHGMGEGTYAELFTATLESEAFFNNNIRELIEKGLSAIPEDSRVYRAVRLVTEEYDKGTSYRDVRNMLVEQSRDIGVFQAPANLGYVAIGLLYGEGDFKNSIIYAVNCGDDTDCTAATVGAILGIVGGTAAIPEDWARHIGEGIEFVCIQTMYRLKMPTTCTELTERIMNLIPTVFYAHRIALEWCDGEDEICEYPYGFNQYRTLERGRYSFDIPHTPYAFGFAEYEREPIVKPGERIKIRLNLTTGDGREERRAYPWSDYRNTANYTVKLLLPEGWSADYKRVFNLAYEDTERGYTPTVWEAEISVGENVEAINHVYVIASSPIQNSPIFIDFPFEA